MKKDDNYPKLWCTEYNIPCSQRWYVLSSKTCYGCDCEDCRTSVEDKEKCNDFYGEKIY